MRDFNKLLKQARSLLSKTAIVLAAFTFNGAQAQTTVLDPAGAGGFELGNTFALNGWTAAQSGSYNLWYVGTFTKSAGTYGCYIGNNSSSNNNYYKGLTISPFISDASRTHHVWRAVTFPAGETDITLSFKWRCAGDNTFGNDDLQVFLAPTSVTPAAGTAINASYKVGGPYFGQGSSYQTVTIKLAAANAGTTQRLIFTWRNNNDLIGSDPAGSFDEVSIKTCAPPPAPTTTSGSICDLGVVAISATPGAGGNSCSWWDAPTGGNLLLASATNVNVTINASGAYTYYVNTENTLTGCSGVTRTAVTAASLPKQNAAPSATVISGCSPVNSTISANATRIGRSTVNYSIPDYNILNSTPGQVTSTLSVSGLSASLNNTTVSINQVKVNINHSYVGDLILKLQAPDGTLLTMSNQVGGGGANYTNTIFKTGGAAISGGTAPFTGTYAPQTAFSTFNGKNPNGTWGLNVVDNAWLSTGNIVNWEISFTDGNGVTYAWTSTPSGFTGTAASHAVSPTVTTTYNVTVSNAQGCTSTGSVAVSVSPNPIPVASSGGDVCEGSDISLSGSNIAAGQGSGNAFQWSGPNGFTSAQQNPSIVNPSAAYTGTYTLTVTNQFLCTASSTTHVTVNPNPTLSILSQIDESCPGANDGQMIVAGSNGSSPYDYTYDFVNFNQDGEFTDLAAGPITIYVSDANGCAGSTSGTILSPNSPPTITCSGTALSVNANAGFCSGTVTNLQLLSKITSTTGLPTPVITFNPPAGTFAVGTTQVTATATNQCGEATCTFDVVVNDTENPTYSNVPANITVGNDNGNCSAVVSWTPPTANDNCSVSSSVGNYNPGATFPLGTTTVIYTATDASNNTGTTSFTVTVNGTAPTTPSGITSDAFSNEICLGGTTNLTAAGGSFGSMGGVYTWYQGSCGGTLLGTGATKTVSPTANTTYYVRIEDNCGNFTGCVSITIAVKTAPPTAAVVVPPIVGLPGTACSGSTASLSIPSVAGATRYYWDGPTGTTFNAGNPYISAIPSADITFGAPNGSGYYIGVQAGNACGNTLRKVQWVRGIVSVPASITGNATACENTGPFTYSTQAVEGATQYLWSITGNATVTGTGLTAQVTFGPAWNGGTLCVAAQTSCYTSATKCFSISKSAAALSNLTGNVTACPNSNATYSVNASSGAATYAWTLPTGATGTSATNTINIAFGPTFNAAGNICVTVTSICGVTSAPKCKSVTPGIATVPASISGPSNGLCGQTVSYTAPQQAGASYNWTSPTGSSVTNGQGTNSVNVAYGTFATGQVCVTATNGCGTSASRCITVKGSPNTPTAITAIPGTWCANESGIEFNADVTNLAGNYTLSWTYPSSPVASYLLGGGNSPSLLLNWGTGNGTISVTATNSCGSGTKVYNAVVSCREGSLVPASKLNVYPNPTTGIVNVEFTVAEKGNVNVQVLDIAGRIMMTQNAKTVVGANAMQLDLKALAKGVYLINLQNNNGNSQVRVVVE